MNDDDALEIQIGSDLYSSPLRDMVEEAHEIFEELRAAGFPRKARTEIIAHMISDAVLYRSEYTSDDEDDIDDDEELDSDDDGDSV